MVGTCRRLELENNQLLWVEVRHKFRDRIREQPLHPQDVKLRKEGDEDKIFLKISQSIFSNIF